MENKTPTPRTDEAEVIARKKYEAERECGWPAFDSSGYDFSRTLELELNEARRKLKTIELVRGTHDCGCEVCGMGSSVCPASASSYALAIIEAKDQLTTTQQELNEAREKLNSVFCPWCQTVYPKGEDGHKAVLEHLSICLKHPITERDNLKQQLTTAQQDLAKIAKALRTQQQRYHDLSEEVEGLKRERDDAIESTVRKCAQIAEESEACCGTGEIIAKKILSLITQKEKKV